MIKLTSKIVIASHNKGKVNEISELLSPFNITVISAAELDLDEPIEDGKDFVENANIKSLAAAKKSGLCALADDSGLCVEALNGDPGIYSARWGGEGKDFYLAMQKLEDELITKGANKKEQRRAYFICVLSLAEPDGTCHIFEGRVYGHLSFPPRGYKGFGYDPVFIADSYDKTFGEIEPDEKQRVSHRTRAFKKMVDSLFKNA